MMIQAEPVISVGFFLMITTDNNDRRQVMVNARMILWAMHFINLKRHALFISSNKLGLGSFREHSYTFNQAKT